VASNWGGDLSSGPPGGKRFWAQLAEAKIKQRPMPAKNKHRHNQTKLCKDEIKSYALRS
jgi:hypothetical protein